MVPDDVDALLTLPGVGTYTARAIACFAYGKRVPVVDTNVRRVVARVVHGRADSPASVRDLADVDAMLPNDDRAPRVLGRADGARRDRVHGAVAAVRAVPAEHLRVALGRLPAVDRAGPASRSGSRAPTDRCAVELLDVLRANAAPVDAGPARRGVADRHRAARPRAGLAARPTASSSRPPTACSRSAEKAVKPDRRTCW